MMAVSAFVELECSAVEVFELAWGGRGSNGGTRVVNQPDLQEGWRPKAPDCWGSGGTVLRCPGAGLIGIRKGSAQVTSTVP